MLAPAQLRAALASWRSGLGGVDGPDALSGLDVPVVVGLSGGADSLALLAVAVAADLQPVAVHVDHGLRAGSSADAERVVTLAGSIGAPARVVRVDVVPGSNLEARARDARYQALEQVREDLGASTVLVGHTADDQAETVLLNLLRGSASAGLGGMAVRREAIVRPLLGVRRAETRELCARLGIAPLDDPMNDDLTYRRVWLRREVMPMLERSAGRDLVPVLTRQAEVLRSESVFLDELAASAWPSSDVADRPSARALGELPVVLARRAVRQWLGAPPPTRDEVDVVMRVALGEQRAADLTGGRRVRRRDGRLVQESTVGAADAVAPVSVTLPGTSRGLGLRLESWVERDAPVRWPDGRWTCVMDADVVGVDARLRRRPSNGQVLLTAAAGEPIWVVGYRIHGRVRVSERTRRFLWVTAVTGED